MFKYTENIVYGKIGTPKSEKVLLMAGTQDNQQIPGFNNGEVIQCSDEFISLVQLQR
jgi:hypothetical protein